MSCVRSPDSNTLLTAGADKSCKLWAVPNDLSVPPEADTQGSTLNALPKLAKMADHKFATEDKGDGSTKPGVGDMQVRVSFNAYMGNYFDVVMAISLTSCTVYRLDASLSASPPSRSRSPETSTSSPITRTRHRTRALPCRVTLNRSAPSRWTKRAKRTLRVRYRRCR